ncbi:GAD-like domain-containing protein [Neorhizobium galegae]|nr:GAD-like domain-containing protein [Neorhizobium galegae]
MAKSIEGQLPMLDSFFEDTIAEIGPPQRCIPMTPEQENRLSKQLPASFMAFLLQYGFGDYFDRKVQYCDPAEFSPILALVFAGDPDFSHRDCFVVGYSAFGRLICWSQRHDQFEIDLVDLRMTSRKLAPTQFILPPGTIKRERSTDPNVLARSLLVSDQRDYEEFDAQDQPMFARCRAMHGDLERNECYGYFPAIATVGLDSPVRRVENIRRVAALEHFAILAQLGTFHLMRLERGQYTAVRPIG